MNYLLSVINIVFIIAAIFISYIDKNKKNLIYTLIILLLSLLFCYLASNLTLSIFNYNILPILLETLIIALFIPLVTRKKDPIILIVLFLIFDPIIKILLSLFLNIPFVEINDSNYYYFSTYVLTVSIFIKLMLINSLNVISKMINNHEIKYTMVIYILEILICFIFFIVINNSMINIVFKDSINYSTLVLTNIIYFSLILLIIITNSLLVKISISRENEINKYKVDNVLNNYQNIYISSQEELFKIRHDIANIINSIKKYNDPLALDIYDDLATKFDNNPTIYFTDNKMLNAILVNKYNEANNLGLNLNIKLLLENDISISNIDLISLLTNLIDNSCNAIKYADNKDIFLTISSSDKLIISIKNSMTNIKEIKKDPQYHGFGTKIIKEIVNKNNGKYDVEKTINTHFVYIELPNNKKAR